VRYDIYIYMYVCVCVIRRLMVSPRSSELYYKRSITIKRPYPKEGHPHTTRKKSEATVPARSTRQRQFDEHQTISPRRPIPQQNTTKHPTNDGRTPMSSLRFYADTHIITTYRLNNTTVFLVMLSM
jgi:hypothetical protein